MASPEEAPDLRTKDPKNLSALKKSEENPEELKVEEFITDVTVRT